MIKILRNTIITFIIVAFGSLAVVADANAAKKKQIDDQVVEALEAFREIVKDADEVLAKAKGVLIFPAIKKAGVGIGGESGSGALQIDGETVDYYRSSSATIGLQLGYQKRSEILIFMTDDSLKNFRDSKNWEVGGSASVALVTLDAAGKFNTETLNDPVIGFVFGASGLMGSLSLDGTKVTKIYPD